MHDPQVLILDEPANGLDPQARIEMRSMLLRLSSLGKTLIVTSHILPELARVCDLVAMITKGKLRAFGTLDEIMRRVQQRRTFELLLLEHDRVEPVAGMVRQWLSEHPGNESAGNGEVTSSEAEMMVRFATSLGDQDVAPLLAHLIGQGVAIAQFREVAADLEDAFLFVAGENEDAETDTRAGSGDSGHLAGAATSDDGEAGS
jgi:ABC-2 type transport system ATP-binding protein